MVASFTKVGTRIPFVNLITLYSQRRVCEQNGRGHAQRRASVSVTAALVAARMGESQCVRSTSSFECFSISNSGSMPGLKVLHTQLSPIENTALQTRRIKYVGRNWAVGLMLFFAGIATSGKLHCVHSSVYIPGEGLDPSLHCAKREGEETPDVLAPSVGRDTIDNSSAHFSLGQSPQRYTTRLLGAGEPRRSTYGPTAPVQIPGVPNCSPTVSVKSFILDSTGSSGSASRLASATPLPDRKSGHAEKAVLWNLKEDGNGWFAIEDLKIDHACIDTTIKSGHHVNIALRISAIEGAKVYLRSTIQYGKALAALGDAVDTLQAQRANTVVQNVAHVRENVQPYESRYNALGHLHSVVTGPTAPDDVTLQQPSRMLSGSRLKGARKDDNSSFPTDRKKSSGFYGQHPAERTPSLDILHRSRMADQPPEESGEFLHDAKGLEDDTGKSTIVTLQALVVDDIEKRPSARTRRRQDLAARVTGIQRTIGVPSSSATSHRSRGASSLQNAFRRHPSITLEPLPSGRYPLATREDPQPTVSSTQNRETPPNFNDSPDIFQRPSNISTAHSAQAGERHFFPLWDGWEDAVLRMMAEIRTLDWTASDRMLQTVRLQVAAALSSDLAGSGTADADLVITSRLSSGTSPRASERRSDTRGRRLQLSREDVSSSAARERYPPIQALHDSIERPAAHESSRIAERSVPRSQVVIQNRLYHAGDSHSTPVSKEIPPSASLAAPAGHLSEGSYVEQSSSTPDEKVRFQSEGKAKLQGEKRGRNSGSNSFPPFLKVVQRQVNDQSRSHHMVVINIDALGRRLDAETGKPLFYNDRVIVGWRCSKSELHTIRRLGLANQLSQTGRTRPPAHDQDFVSEKPAIPAFCSRADLQGKGACGRVPPHLGLETRRAADKPEHAFKEDHPAPTPQMKGGTDECNTHLLKRSCDDRRSTREIPRRRLQVLSHMLDQFAAHNIDCVTPLFRRVPLRALSQAEKVVPLTKADPEFPKSSGSPAEHTYPLKQNEGAPSALQDTLAPGEEYLTLRGSSSTDLRREPKVAVTAIADHRPTLLKTSPEPGDARIKATARDADGDSVPTRAGQPDRRSAERLAARTLVDADELCGLDLIKLSLHAPRRQPTETAETYRFREDDVTALKAFIDKFASHDYVDDILFIAPDAPIHATAGVSPRVPENRNGAVSLQDRVQDTVLGANFTAQHLAGEAVDDLVFEPTSDDPSYTDVPQPVGKHACGEQMARPLPGSGHDSAVACSVARSLQARGPPAEGYTTELPNDPLFAVQWALGSSRPYERMDSETCFATAQREMLRDATEAPVYGNLTTTTAHHVVTESQLAKIRRLCETVDTRNLHGNEAVAPSQGRLQADRVRSSDEGQESLNAEGGSESTAPSVIRKYGVALRDRQQGEMKLQKTSQKRESGMGHSAKGAENDNSIKMLQAWGLKLKEDQDTYDSTVTVAVIDTGVNYAHPDLVDSMWINEKELNGISGYDDDNNGYIDDVYGWNFLHDNNNPMDDNGHGTHVAGIIGAQRNNHKGVSGISSHAKIIALKILDENGDGDVSHAIPAIRYALDNGARIITNSWGGIVGPGTHILGVLLREAVSDANSSVFVIASGNDGRDITKEPYYPASFLRDWTITVAAHTPDGIIPRWSNYGQRTVHLTAPGENITSTWLGGGYRLSSGTSMAAPMVSGVAAEILAYSPHLQPQQVVDALIQSSTPDMKQKSASLTGARLNAVRALILSQMHFFSVSSSELHVGGENNHVCSVNVRLGTQTLPSGVYHGNLELIYVRRVGSKHTSMLTSVFKRRLIQLVQISLPVTMTVL